MNTFDITSREIEKEALAVRRELQNYHIEYNGHIIKTGTFKECWGNLIEIFGNRTLSEVSKMDVKIEIHE